ncbi:ankyrin repeat domain-containing protein [Singulisphaera sp. PoT]|uniref:ankyrin repeat domain-containing protein n=1 Tax=Singulisphaera sp. PoT TaxID=3411797 RepID=UPI003BF58852
MMSRDEVERIEINSLWIGFAHPPRQSARLVITRRGGRYLREWMPGESTDEMPADLVDRLLEALAKPRVPQLDFARFDFPEPVLRRHYESGWTDDYPRLLAKIQFASGRTINIQTDVQKAFMLPLRVDDSAEPGESKTFDPGLSRAIAVMMPEGFLEKNRLSGNDGTLRWELQEYRKSLGEPEARPEIAEVEAEPSHARTLVDDLDLSAAEVLDPLAPAEPAEAGTAEKRDRKPWIIFKHLSPDELRRRLEAGADPSVADDVGQTALMHAMWPLRREQFRLLAEAGADVEARRKDGLNGLHIACSGAMPEEVKEWLRAGADVEARTPEGATPLMLASGWVDVIKLLLAAGADVNRQDNGGHSALDYSILIHIPYEAEPRLAAFRALISAGADVNLRDRQGITPLGHARAVLARIRSENDVLQAFEDAGISRMRMNDETLIRTMIGIIKQAGGRD